MKKAPKRELRGKEKKMGVTEGFKEDPSANS